MWNNNKIYWYLIILVSLFILVLCTRTQVSGIQISLDEKEQKEIQLQSNRDEVNKLNWIKSKITSENIDLSKYFETISEDKLISYIYWEIERNNTSTNWWTTIVRSLSISEPTVNEIGFKETKVVLNLRVGNEEEMYKILDFFIKEDSKYKFFIESFTYPNTWNDTNFNVTIPLKIYNI